jgi:hypothetical protein
MVNIMFSVDEYYSFSKTYARTTRHVERLSTLEDAKALAESVYQEVSRIPESEAVWIGVMDESKGRMVYSQPEEPFSKSNPNI